MSASEVDDADVLVYFYTDYEELDALDDDIGRFHAQWRRQLTSGVRPGRSNAAPYACSPSRSCTSICRAIRTSERTGRVRASRFHSRKSIPCRAA